MYKKTLNNGSIEFIPSPEEKDVQAKMKTLKDKLKTAKKGSDISNADVADLVYVIAKHLKII